MANWGESSGAGSTASQTNTNDGDWSDVTIPDYTPLPEQPEPLPPSCWLWYAHNATSNIPGELTVEGPQTHPTIIARTDPPSTQPQVRQSDNYFLKYYGFKINWQSCIGTGSKSMGIYMGIFGRNIGRCKDADGQYLQGVNIGDRFAAKYALLDGDEDIRNYQSEKQVIKHLDHPNIVRFRMAINLGPRIPVYHPDDPTVHWFDTYPCMMIIMEYADQGALKQFQFRDEFNDQNVFNDVIIGICQGQKYLTQRGVVHDDVHTGNVLIFSDYTNDGGVSYTAKMADFGYTRALIGHIPGHLTTVNEDDFNNLVQTQLETLAYFIIDIFETIEELPELQVNLLYWNPVIEQLQNKISLDQIFPD